jgi:predicted nucleic acid-binding protein
MARTAAKETFGAPQVVTGLVDSSILIDVMRNYSPAQAWLGQQGQLGVTRIVWLELLEGAENKTKQLQAILLLKRFVLIPMTDTDMVWAVEKMTRFGLSHNVDAFDCLIASVHPRLNLPLYTRNLKHFRPLIAHLAISPY